MLRYIGPVLLAIAILALVADRAFADTPHARPVALTDALRPPTVLYYVPGVRVPARLPHAASSPAVRCLDGVFPTDVSAYTWDGLALGPQRWNRAHDRTYWNVKRGAYVAGRVVYDGDRFWNYSRLPVLVAGWCES